ncbi:MAG: hypothetical protein RBG13Loki_3053 [Promethearchaeota archaeon CR_4]|nr:MAG: hypothetical protein RBG13Loki_3053 [Candidatus Lokiarchaeota archaeon CR_4]
MNVVSIAKAEQIPIVFTPHDYWMQCLRGQLLTSKMQLCPAPSEVGCVNMYSALFSLRNGGPAAVSRVGCAHLGHLLSNRPFYRPFPF